MVGWCKSGLGRKMTRSKDWLCLVALAVCWTATLLGAQDRASAGKPDDVQGVPTPTLHVYENLLQVPVLVLWLNRYRIQNPIPGERFSVSVDEGPWFRATHVRREGDDPISLSILLDVSGDEGLLMPKMAEAIAALATGSLQPQDQVSVYALDCSLIRGPSNVPADSAVLKRSVDEVLRSRTARNSAKGWTRSDCKQTDHLWDALAELTDALHKLPGRRVILVVSDGVDKGSAHTWNQVRVMAQDGGVAIFGMTYATDLIVDRSEMRSLTSPTTVWGVENPFRSLCELSGGTVRLASPRTLEEKLRGFTAMVRERYIVEFPRPSNAKAGRHGLLVRIDKGDYFIRPAGIMFPLMDPAVLADPTTVASDPSKAPTMGSRRPLASPR